MGTKGDMMDYIVMQLGKGEKYGRIISDYPETVQGVLREFLNVWMIPEWGIPKRGKKESSSYKEWVSNLQSLESLCGGKLSLIKEGYEHYISSGQTFMVTCPRNILKLMVDVIARKNREEFVKEQSEKEDVYLPVTTDTVLENLKRLGKEMRGE
jgi:hypothetical protein